MTDMSTHTPGPWRAKLTRGKHGYSDFYNVLGPQYEVCRMMGIDHEDKANARLIAAAPDLLEALRDLVARCDGSEGVRADGSNIETLAAHLAIAKAEE